MWKKQQENAAQRWPQSIKKEKQARGTYNEVVFVQILICLIAALCIFACKMLLPSVYQTVSAEYKALVTNGVDYSSETPLIRFANANAESIRTAVDNLAENMQKGAGGAYKISTQTVPSGASLEAYTLSETMQLPLHGTLTSAFGFRENPVDGENDFHMGVDIAADEGTPVQCALDGQVIKTGTNTLRGNYIIVRHKDGCCTLYQHLLYSYVRSGTRVKKGEVLAAAGSTGYVTGPHLHFEIILNGIRVNPQYALDI